MIRACQQFNICVDTQRTLLNKFPNCTTIHWFSFKYLMALLKCNSHRLFPLCSSIFCIVVIIPSTIFIIIFLIIFSIKVPHMDRTARIGRHTRIHGPYGPHLYIAQHTSKYGSYHPYMAQHSRKIPKIRKSKISSKI